MTPQVDLVRAFLQMEGNLDLDMTKHLPDGSIRFGDIILDQDNVNWVNE